MTAIIGVMNKKAVAIAADSAVSVDTPEGHKIYNSANKIFTLSKYHPIAVMIYNSSEFLGIPWETVIKMYRCSIKNKDYERAIDYKDDFIRFIKTDIILKNLVSNSTKNSFIMRYVDYLVRKAKDKLSLKENLQIDLSTMQIGDHIYNGFKDLLLEFKAPLLKYVTEPRQHDFINTTVDDFSVCLKDELSDYLKQFAPSVLDTEEIRNILLEIVLCYFKSDIYGPFTGLVFVGFGKSDIFPCSYHVKIGEAFQDKFRYTDVDSINVTDENHGIILPFAQRDIMDLVITGLHPDIIKTYNKAIYEILDGFRELLVSVTPGQTNLHETINKLDISPLTKSFEETIQGFCNDNFVLPIVNTVSTMTKEDMADMAESLIKLTYLHRRMSFNEESVGGPVDVALISKGDGFVWIKRKHYFAPELNPHFFNKYYT